MVQLPHSLIFTTAKRQDQPEQGTNGYGGNTLRKERFTFVLVAPSPATYMGENGRAKERKRTKFNKIQIDNITRDVWK